jgi:hypothetical protein
MFNASHWRANINPGNGFMFGPGTYFTMNPCKAVEDGLAQDEWKKNSNILFVDFPILPLDYVKVLKSDVEATNARGSDTQFLMYMVHAGQTQGCDASRTMAHHEAVVSTQQLNSVCHTLSKYQLNRLFTVSGVINVCIANTSEQPSPEWHKLTPIERRIKENRLSFNNSARQTD